MTLIATLRELQRLGPTFCERLGRQDYQVLCQRLHHLSQRLHDNPKNPSIRCDMEDTLQRLDERIPGFVAHVRGSLNDEATLSVEPSSAGARQVALEIKESLLRELAGLRQQQEADASAWLGQPELFVFDRLPPKMRERATRIRDWCEDRLEFMHSRGQMRYWTAHGIGHSKRVLRHGIDLLRAFDDHFIDPLSYFVIYTSAYCHDLGLMFWANEDPECEETFARVRKTHGRRMWELIMGNEHDGTMPAWRAMGFSSEREAMLVANVCAVHPKAAEDDLKRLPFSQDLFVDGATVGICTYALAATLRLADALDCHEKRLPPDAYMKHRDVPVRSIHEYLKHELVEEVQVAEDAIIHIAMRVRYSYPDTSTASTVRDELSQEISDLHSLLSRCRISLPEPRFNCVEALFLEDHPFGRHGVASASPAAKVADL
jgi:hypothetical protein